MKKKCKKRQTKKPKVKHYTKADLARALQRKVKGSKAETLLTGRLSPEEIMERDTRRFKQTKTIAELFSLLVETQPLWDCFEEIHQNLAKALLRTVKRALLRHGYDGPMPTDWVDVAFCTWHINKNSKFNLKPMPEIMKNVCLSEKTLYRCVKKNKLTDYRPKDHAPNAPMILDLNEITKLYPDKIIKSKK